jgi:hypothetical protein
VAEVQTAIDEHQNEKNIDEAHCTSEEGDDIVSQEGSFEDLIEDIVVEGGH